MAVKPGTWKILLGVGIGLLFIAFILGWIGFGVPDWHAFQRFNGSSTEYYGLWAYCQEQAPLFSSVCKRWSTAEDQLFNGTRPSFVRTAEGLITVGMILLSLGLIAAVFAAILPLLAYLAGALALLAFLFLIIGLPIFGRESNRLSDLRKDATKSKRYGFWLIVPTIILTFISAVLFLVAAFLYQRFGYGNIATNSGGRRAPGGSRARGPPNFLRGLPYANVPGMYGRPINPYQYQPGMVGRPTSLLSQYIVQRLPRGYAPPMIRPAAVTVLPQPSISQVVGQPTAYVTPAYYRAPTVVQPYYAPRLNLTGQTIVAAPGVYR